MRDIGEEFFHSDDESDFKALTLDIDKYQSYLDDADLSEEERTQILNSLWTIICCFVELGYSVEPLESCGQTPSSDEHPPAPFADVIKSERNPFSNAFACAASQSGPEREES